MTRSGFSWLQNFDITQLLMAIRNDCERITHIGDRARLQEELNRLIRQSKQPLVARDKKEILFIWRRIHPDLRYYGILNGYDREPMKTRILNFLKGLPIEKKFSDDERSY